MQFISMIFPLGTGADIVYILFKRGGHQQCGTSTKIRKQMIKVRLCAINTIIAIFGTCNGCKFGNVMTSVVFLKHRPPTKMMIRHGDDDAGKAAANFAD